MRLSHRGDVTPLKITQEVRAFALEQAGRRCECTGKDCRHHLHGARCKRGLRGDEWKVFWRTERGGATRDNIEAWCLECFANNFAVPRETVSLLASDIVGYARLIEEDRWRAITAARALRSSFEELVLRLDLPIPELCGAIHCGEVTRWRNGLLAGDAVEITMSVRGLAGVGRIVLTEPAAAPLRGKVELEPIAEDAAIELPPVGRIWALRL
jgi:class 3 adenylate cyclase